MRIYEWGKFIFKEKFKAFSTGFTGSSLVAGVLLFGSGATGSRLLVITFILKCLGVFVCGIIGGVASILGKDLGEFIRKMWQTKENVRNERKKKRKAA